MAATNYTPIQLYNSGTTTNAPIAADLAAGELAINYKDGLLFYKDDANAIQKIGYKITPATAGGTGVANDVAMTVTGSGNYAYTRTLTGITNVTFPTSGTLLTTTGSAASLTSFPTLNQDTTGTAATAVTATKTNALNSATTVVNVSSATAPTAGQVLTATSGTAATWTTPAGGVSLAGTNTWTGAQTFTNSLLKLLGSSTGATTFTSANTSATDYVVTFPASTDTIVNLTSAQTLTNKTIAGATNDVEARSLKTATTTVIVSGSAAPSSGQVLTASSSTAAAWQAPSSGALTLIATLTPTAAANLDFLTTFSSTYDCYLIVGTGIASSATGLTDAMNIRLATGGSVDTGSYYYDTSVGGNATDNSATATIVTGIQSPTGNAAHFRIFIAGVNSTRMKLIQVDGAGSYLGGGYGLWGGNRAGAYTATNTASGFRLYWGAGASFEATGKVRVYGYANA